MRRAHRLTLSALVLSAGLLSATRADAGPVADWFGCGDCPPPSYSPFRYWTPALAHLYDCTHGPRLPVNGTTLHPEIAPGVTILKYPCPPAQAADTLIPTPTAPATSRFRY